MTFGPSVFRTMEELSNLCDQHNGPCALDCYILSGVVRYMRGEISAEQISIRAYREFSNTLHRNLVDV